jgi:hypothetical protein
LTIGDPAGVLTVTGLHASTVPLSVPSGEGVDVAVAVGVSLGPAVEVDVSVLVGVSLGPAVDVDVGVLVGVSLGPAVEVDVGVFVGVSLGPPVGVDVGVLVGVALGPAVRVGVAVPPFMVRLVPVDGIWVSTLSPFDTRAVHSIAVWPAARPLTLNVNAAPLVVALLPLLPAIATMKLPFAGPLIATAASAPNRGVTMMLLLVTSTRLAL